MLRILSRYLSQMLARQVLDRASGHIGRTLLQLSTGDMPKLVEAIVRDARAFLDPNNVGRLKTELDTLLPESARLRGPLDLEIRIESDIAQARMAAKEICESLGGNRLAVQRAATIVSEITRNMVSYAGGGRIELIPKPRPTAALVIKASDHGPGIKNLNEILGGHYKSRTGLGLGILAAKRLSDHFEIESDSTGTRLMVEVRLT